MILDTIVETKRREVAARKAATPLAGLEKMIAAMPPARDFKAALVAGAGCAIIAEVKRRSPSRGLLRADFDPVRIAREYERHGAAAISVLTDETFFGGSDADLAAVKSAVSLPVLRKEFIIDPYQICETRAIGADAILLIAAILTEGQLREYRELAASLGMAALVEVHDREELEKALAAGAEIIGINNRDLKTFVTDHPDLHRPRAAHSERPDRRQRKRDPDAGGDRDAFEGGDPGVSDRRDADRGPGDRAETGGAPGKMTEIKICGITRIDDALCAAACGADAIGFIFHPASPRYIAPERAKEIVAALPRGIATVGRLRQPRGGGGGADGRRLRPRPDPAPRRRIAGVLPPVSAGADHQGRLPPDARRSPGARRLRVRAFLVDSRDAGRYGGTGKRADWELAARLAKERPLILAGGLSIENIGEALAAVAPGAVDINSGIERAPGIKDHDRMKRIIGLIRARGVPRPNVIFDMRTMNHAWHPGT